MERMFSYAVRFFALVATAVVCYCNTLFMENLDKNPLASYGIYGMSAAAGVTLAVIYLINDNKGTKRKKK